MDDETNVPILAAAAGKVVEVINDKNHPNGCHVVLEHDYPYDNDVGTGFTTRYLHLKENSITVYQGEEVLQGHRLGTMGDTGISPGGIHLHFGVRYNGSGAQNVSELTQVRLEGRPLVDYQIICSQGQRIAYYFSTNTEAR